MTESEENLYWDRGSERDIYESILLTPNQRLDTAILISLTWLLVVNLNVTLCHCEGLWIRRWRTEKNRTLCLRKAERSLSNEKLSLLLPASDDTIFKGKFVLLTSCTPYRGQSYFSKWRRTRCFESVITAFWTTLIEDIRDNFKLCLTS